MKPTTPPASRRAFTAAEAIISLASITLIIFALGAGLTVSTRAAASAPADADFAEAASAVEQLVSEVSTAHAITEISGAALEFVANDVTGDLRPDLVRYEWSTVLGDPLTRSVNGSTPVAVIPDIGDLTLSATNAAPSIGPALTLKTVVEGKLRIAKPRDMKDLGDDVRLAYVQEPATAARALEPGQVIRQSVEPFFSNNANIDITRLRIRALQAGPVDTALFVRLIECDKDGNVEEVLFETGLHERQTAGHGFDWITLDVAGVEKAKPKDLAIEIAAAGPANAMAPRLLLTNTAASASARVESTNGTTFSEAPGTLAFELYGAHPSSKSEVQETLRAVRVKIATTTSPDKLIDTTVYLANTEIVQ